MPTPESCSGPETSQFDFWLGEWDLTWPAEQTGGEEGEIGRGTNRIEKVLGGCVIEEQFAFVDGSFLGRSLSVYQPWAMVWRQTWVDTQGNYLLFSGQFDGDRMELRTEPRERDGQVMINRMVFSQITEPSLLWEWQGSRDNGEIWDDLWTISYTRRK